MKISDSKSGRLTKYDKIGTRYSDLRQSDDRIQKAIDKALGSAQTVLNVGAGTGSYEPINRQITAVEPSMKMIRQRQHSAALVVQGRAEHLPFVDNSFDASMATLTIHHWSDKQKGLNEMRRVTTGPIVLLTYDPAFRDFWLLDYFPELIELDESQMPTLSDLSDWMGNTTTIPMPIPHDCQDGFLSAYWRRPMAYLEPSIREAMSSFWAIGDITIGLEKLQKDLVDGTWNKRYASLLNLTEKDCGYRLVISEA